MAQNNTAPHFKAEAIYRQFEVLRKADHKGRTNHILEPSSVEWFFNMGGGGANRNKQNQEPDPTATT